jgi:hypothetical protein
LEYAAPEHAHYRTWARPDATVALVARDRGCDWERG